MSSPYSLRDYLDMIADRRRMHAYAKALRQSVKPGSVVLDIGTGTGIFALLACQSGARRVYAIEPGDVIATARDLAAVNGYTDRIEFIQAISTQVTLPESADIIVSDLHGVFPFHGTGVRAIIEARQRFLAPGGMLIPRRDTLWGAVAEAPSAYKRLVTIWNEENLGLNLGAVQKPITNTWLRTVISPDRILTSFQNWGILDYETVESPDIRSEITWTVTRPGTAHGLLLWFDTDLFEGVGFSNAPSESWIIYGQGFFPWPDPVELAVGDSVSARISVDLVGYDYVWQWDTQIIDPGRPDQPKASFRQSTFFSVPLSPANLLQTVAGHVPELSQEGRIDAFILELMKGALTLGDIAQQVARQFPQRFANAKEALTRAGELSLKYGRQPDSKYLRQT
jgi:type I protein arginine methyltransferase